MIVDAEGIVAGSLLFGLWKWWGCRLCALILCLRDGERSRELSKTGMVNLIAGTRYCMRLQATYCRVTAVPLRLVVQVLCCPVFTCSPFASALLLPR